MTATPAQGSTVSVPFPVELSCSAAPPPPSIRFIRLPTVVATEVTAGVSSAGVATSISIREFTTICGYVLSMASPLMLSDAYVLSIIHHYDIMVTLVIYIY